MSELYPLILVLKILAIAAVLIVSWMMSEAWSSYKRWRLGKEAHRMSQYGIRLPAPKIGLPKHLESEESLLGWFQHTISRDVTKDAQLTYCHHWRIERARADDLERMVEKLEAENRRLRKPRILSLFKRKQ